MTKPVKIIYFSDVLCIWAYAAQIRLDELSKQFGGKIELEQRFISVFGCADEKIGGGWSGRGGYEGYAKHICTVAEKFPHITVNPEIWSVCRPATSAMSHLFLKAAQLSGDHDAFDVLTRQVRSAFFVDARDVSSIDVLFSVADEAGFPVNLIKAALDNGRAMAALCCDMELKDKYNLEGSPSYIMDNGRQKLYGNVGYHVIEANIKELLESPGGQASWC